MFSIHTNMGALVAYRNMGLHQTQIQKSLRRLSSGYRINSAADDAAGLAISEKMRGQIRGLRQASVNAQHAISLLQTAEGGLNETHAILQRMRELAVQAANGTYLDEVDRENLNKEYQALMDEIDRISSATNYNGIPLLDGSGGGRKGADGITGLGLASGSLHIDAASADAFVGTGKLVIRRNDDNSVTFTLQAGGKTYTENKTADGDVEFQMEDSTKLKLAGVALANVKEGSITNISFDGTSSPDQKGMISASGNDKLIFQIGANGTLDQQTGVHVGDMSTASLGDKYGLRSTDILTRENAAAAIEAVKKATNQVSSARGDIGAQINRLEHTINNLDTTAENLQAAESSIRDADMAEEMMNYVKHSILLQAAQAMMAQAMAMPNLILEMLRSL